jgi:hypothetical protein
MGQQPNNDPQYQQALAAARMAITKDPMNKDEIELLASRLRIKNLEDAIARHKQFVLANYDEPDCSIVENLELWQQ